MAEVLHPVEENKNGAGRRAPFLLHDFYCMIRRQIWQSQQVGWVQPIIADVDDGLRRSDGAARGEVPNALPSNDLHVIALLRPA
ncbi:hypothetical protein ACFQAT_08300 [Undibacterium arcticum]|uniref:hypothetical protein n=1 Tax=Undibacterium arcticum TaxID=1762892 RepID=UPI003623D7BE